MKNVFRTISLLLCLSYAIPSTIAQITYKLELLPDQDTYQVSMIPDTTWTFPYNLTSSAQVTIRVPHGTGDYRFILADLTSSTPNTDWDNNARVDMPPEAPAYDYLSFGLLNLGTDAYEYTDGVEIPLFSFRNGGVACVDSIQLLDNNTDPFRPPNSYNANIGNAIAVLGAGLVNAYTDNVGTGRALCTPEPNCAGSIETIEEITICNGEDYQGIPIMSDTTFSMHYISFAGCDSVASTQITLIQPDTVEVYQVDCHSGISMPVRDTMTSTYTNSYGCDSVVIVYNETQPVFDTTFQVSLPEGLLYEGVAYENDTTFTSYGLTSYGCDSTVTVEITILDNPTTFINTPLCEGDTFEGQVFTTNASIVDTIPLPSGVDSLVINNIIILPSYHDTLNITLCEGELYQNVSYSQDTILMEFYITNDGCDSTIVTEIVVTDSYETFQEFEICSGELFESVLYQQDTTFTETYTTSSGCDSTVYTQLIVHELPEAIISGKTEICYGDQSELSVTNAATYLWSNGSQNQSISVDTSGIYAVTVTNELGCSNEGFVEFTAHQLEVSSFVTPAGCEEFDTGSITFQSTSTEPLLYSVTGGFGFSNNPLFENLLPGTYDLVVKDNSGCQWEDQQVLSAPEELLINLGDDMRIQLGDSVAIDALSRQSNISLVEWSPAAPLSCSDCSEPMAQPLVSTLFSVTVVDENGCVATDDIHIFVNREPKLYFPNAFSPDGDGTNDIYSIFGGAGVREISTFRIFNRWGSLMFEQTNFSPNNPEYGWDGKFHNQEVQGGVFVYMAEVELLDGSTLMMKGDFTLIR